MINGIDSISTTSNNSNILSSSNNIGMSYAQQAAVQTLLSSYDSNSITQTQASEIVGVLQQLEIQPSKELSELMDDLGFDAQEIGNLAGLNSKDALEASSSSNSEKNEEESISSILDILLDDDKNEKEKNSASFETVLDYTSRILSLKDDAKDEVKELLENYSPENTNLSREEAKTVVQNALNEILGNENNYNTTSFYG